MSEVNSRSQYRDADFLRGVFSASDRVGEHEDRKAHREHGPVAALTRNRGSRGATERRQDRTML